MTPRLSPRGPHETIELHAHSNCSDGTLSPRDLVRSAVEIGLGAIALSDHDTMAGVEPAQDEAGSAGVELIPGAEISCIYEGRQVHLLGYWCRLDGSELAEELARVRESRKVRAGAMVEKLRALGLPVTVEQVMRHAVGGNPGRPHVARALVEIGAVTEVKDAFTPELIALGGRAYVEKYALDPKRAVTLIREAHGSAVLAHPAPHAGSPGVEDGLIVALVAAGLAGIEAGHIYHSPADVERYRRMAAELGLIATAGSDCHGSPLTMGTCTVDRATLERLRDRRTLAQ